MQMLNTQLDIVAFLPEFFPVAIVTLGKDEPENRIPPEALTLFLLPCSFFYITQKVFEIF